MKILIAEDDSTTRLLLTTLLQKEGYDVLATNDGSQAMMEFRKPNAPGLAILDWEMPNMDGIEVSRRVRERGDPAYLLIVTSRSQKENVVAGLKSGADDYITKPFDHEELLMRVKVGERIVNLQLALTAQVGDTKKALEELRALKGEFNIPI